MIIFLSYLCIGLLISGSISIYFHRTRINYYEHIKRLERLESWCNEDPTEIGKELSAKTRRMINQLEHPSPTDIQYLYKHYRVIYEPIATFILTTFWPVILFLTLRKK